MKMFCVVYESIFDDPITGLFKRAGISTYMKFHNTTGEDAPSKALMGTLGPSKDEELLAAFMPVPDGEILKLIQIVRELKAEYPSVGIGAFTFPLEELVL